MKLLHEHVVVLMLENRSFDHLFGYLGVVSLVVGHAERQANVVQYIASRYDRPP